MFRSLILAFSLYSRIPMPFFKASEKESSYTLCFFPLVGLVLGIIEAALVFLSAVLSFNPIVISALCIILPIVYTGGIHADGFMDTTDALRSYKPKDERIRIMDDPHCGAFAVIGIIVYILFSFACVMYIAGSDFADMSTAAFLKSAVIVSVFVFSRSLSAYTSLVFPKAKRSGMLYGITASGTLKRSILPVLFMTASMGTLFAYDIILGLVFFFLQGVLFIRYYRMTDTAFGGVTGDTAGWLLCMSEALGAAAIAVYMILKGFI